MLSSDQRTELQMVLASELRAARHRVSMTQQQVAEHTGMLRPIVARIEAGRHMVSIDTLIRYADAVGVDPHVLLAPLSRALERMRAGEAAE